MATSSASPSSKLPGLVWSTSCALIALGCPASNSVTSAATARPLTVSTPAMTSVSVPGRRTTSKGWMASACGGAMFHTVSPAAVETGPRSGLSGRITSSEPGDAPDAPAGNAVGIATSPPAKPTST